MKSFEAVVKAAAILWLCCCPAASGSVDIVIVDMRSSTSNEALINSEFNMSFISRGRYGVSGFVHISKEVQVPDLMVEVDIGYNSKNYTTFRPTAAHVGPTDVLTFMNGFYKKYLMPWVANCSNAPQSDAPWVDLDHFPDHFVADRCVLALDGVPETRTGYYCFTYNMVKSGLNAVSADIKVIMEFQSSF